MNISVPVLTLERICPGLKSDHTRPGPKLEYDLSWSEANCPEEVLILAVHFYCPSLDIEMKFECADYTVQVLGGNLSRKMSSHATHQEMLIHSHLSSLSHSGLILAERVESVCVS